VLDEYAKISTAYALAESPEQPFRVDASPENIFFLQHSDASNPGVNAGLASMYGNPAFQGRGLVKISPVIWTAPFWETNDLRRQLLTSSSSIGVFTTKYDAYSTYDDPTPVIRFAEVVLNAAEAYARTNQLDEAVTLVNRVRGRALPGGAPLTVGGLGGDVTGVLQAVLNERRIEFLAEGRRWSDIHRLSGEGVLEGVPPKAPSRSVTTIDLYQPGALTASSHSLPYTSHLFVWPLPIDEVVNNPLMAEQQNPGY
jgi:starch-binding outer membrane protein, SusD/RagB family